MKGDDVDADDLTRALERLPADAATRLRRYVEEGGGPSLGSFHRLLLSNDLVGAVRSADRENLEALPAYAEFLATHAPAGCHGSPQAVQAWTGLGPLGG